MTIRERMQSGKIYRSNDPELAKEQLRYNELVYDFNNTRPSEGERRQQLLKEIFAEVGEECWIEPPMRANWGCHTHLGNKVYANFNLALVDDTHVYIGDSVMIGPNVVISAAGHPVDPDLRLEAAQYNLPIYIEENVWIGASVTILPGVRIGKNSVIGAGSVVSRNIPPNVVAVGVPCKVLREIGEHDKEFYFRDLKMEDGLSE